MSAFPENLGLGENGSFVCSRCVLEPPKRDPRVDYHPSYSPSGHLGQESEESAVFREFDLTAAIAFLPGKVAPLVDYAE
jgi:hypothetical protein